MRDEHFTAIRKWAEKYTNLAVRPANINKSRDEYPYVVVNLISEMAVGIDDVCIEHETGADTIDTTVVGQRQFTVSIQAHSLDQHQAENGRFYLSKLRTSFKLPSVIETFSLAGLSTIRVSPMQNIDRQIEGKWESLWTMDVEFGAVDTLTESAPFIEAVKLTDEISTPNNSFTIP